MSLLDALIEADLATPPVAIGSLAQREIWICIRSDGGNQAVFGSGLMNDPYDGSTAAKFDAVMNLIFGLTPINNPLVRIGPGEFQTRGGSAAGWFAKNGRIVGSGMFVTTLKMIDVNAANEIRALVNSATNLDSFELSDLTLDANIAGQPNSPKPGGGTYDYARLRRRT